MLTSVPKKRRLVKLIILIGNRLVDAYDNTLSSAALYESILETSMAVKPQMEVADANWSEAQADVYDQVDSFVTLLEGTPTVLQIEEASENFETAVGQL